MIMESVNVLLVNLTPHRPTSEKSLRQITATSPRIELQDISDLVSAEQAGDVAASKRLDALLAEAEVIYGSPLPRNFIARAPKLKWIQHPMAGVERFMSADFIESPIILTNTSGMHGQVAELVLAMILMFAKQAQLCFRLKQEKRWQSFNPEVLDSKTVGIVGLGSIGQQVARLAKTFDMQVVATRARRTARSRYADVMLPPERLKELLSQSDFVVVAVPSTPETRGLVGEAELRAMKPTAYFINIARGDVVDEEALILALSEHWIAGAGLDVFATEPLPVGSQLWDFPNVIITPHIGGRMTTYFEKATDIFCENLRRYVNGQKLRNVIDKKKGY